MFKSQIVDGANHRTGREWWRRILHMKHVHRMLSQFPSERQRNPDYWRVRQGLFDGEVGPTIDKPIDGLGFSDIERVAIGLIDFGEGLDQISGVGYVAAQFSSDGMSINSDTQNE